MSFKVDDYLASFVNWEPRLDKAGVSSFGVERMETLLKALGHPESGLLFAHIAGSKGKGSTSVFLANILHASGYRVGLYTSPHLYTYHERIRVLEPGVVSDDPFEGMISSEGFDRLVSAHKEAVDAVRAQGIEITYYELITALAIVYFASRHVKVVVLETGLGGRLDATNVFETSVCGITPIGLEHTAILGETLGKIAAEKAAIIKSISQKAVFAPQAPEAMTVLKARARSFGILPTVVGVEMPVEILEETTQGVRFNVTGRREYRDLLVPLAGAHQAENAALALAMAEDLEMYGLALTEEAVRAGLTRARWPGRFEIFDSRPLVVVDAAHTVESAAACARTFKRLFPGRQAVLLLGVGMDKDIGGICRELGAVANSVVATQAAHPRALAFSAEMLHKYFPSTGSAVREHAAEAFQLARQQAGNDGIVLAAGSVFLAAEVRKECININHI
ncbi:MAG: bifunctional folylpolyglutamate synthase/dihydrofolate synthase [Candidatus Omnitrophica bacterium]|nr:bifunctional folylpolyglutamate synthase/dihydrofolate synthase [Candidatus Omnitrophota bacterium]